MMSTQHEKSVEKIKKKIYPPVSSPVISRTQR